MLYISLYVIYGESRGLVAAGWIEDVKIQDYKLSNLLGLGDQEWDNQSPQARSQEVFSLDAEHSKGLFVLYFTVDFPWTLPSMFPFTFITW